MAATAKNSRDYRRKLKKRAFDLIGRQCVFCTKKRELHAAHVRPTGLKSAGRGLDRRYRDVIKHPECYCPMCQEHHQLFDFLRSLWVSEPEEPILF